MTPRRIAAVVVVAALVMVASASTANTLTLTLVSQNNTTITLGWTPQPGYGYLFSANGNLVSRTNDASRSTVKFSKGFSAYEVAVIVKGAIGTYPTEPPPPPPAACADGIDNDQDGKIDYPADPGCSSATDTDETDAPPPPTGFPDASNTGVPAGTTLTAYTGPSTITTPNTVIDSKSMGCVDIETTGVVIRKSVIRGKCFFLVDVTGGSKKSVTIQDSVVDCQNTPNSGVVGDYITLLRVNIYGCENGGSVDGNWDIRDSYIHDFFMNNPTTHSDGLQTFGGVSNVQVIHNTIIAIDEDNPGAQTATAAIIADEPNHANWLVANNKFGGAGFTIYCGGSGSSNWVIRDNAFTNVPVPPAYGFSRGCGASWITQSGNYIYETGKPITLG